MLERCPLANNHDTKCIVLFSQDQAQGLSELKNPNIITRKNSNHGPPKIFENLKQPI